MLFNLKKKTSPRLTLPKMFGSVNSIPFNPLTLATYRAGYLMNLTNQIPSGSINHTALSQWLDAVLLDISAKYLQANTDITVPETINGFQAFGFTGLVDQAYNIPFDLFNSVTDYTQVIGFKKVSGDQGFLFYRRNATFTNESWIFMRTPGILEIQLGNGVGGAGTRIIAQTVNQYNDGNPHIVIATYNQSTKQIDLFTDLGEHIIASNVAYLSGSLNAGSQFDVMLGQWSYAGLSFNPGLFSDMFLYSSILSIADINKLMNYEATRLGISYTPF